MNSRAENKNFSISRSIENEEQEACTIIADFVSSQEGGEKVEVLVGEMVVMAKEVVMKGRRHMLKILMNC